MKVLICGINYAPELTGIGKYTSELAESLACRGHEVRVLCAPPYYPEWRVGHGYKGWRYSYEERGGVQVWRAPVWVPRAPNGLKRLAHLASFAFFSIPSAFRHIFWRPDAVIGIAPNLLNAPATWMLARMTGAVSWLHIQDYEVEAAFELGQLRGRGLRRVALEFERVLLRRFGVVSTISQKMIERALCKGVDARRLFPFPNWVDTNEIFPLTRASEYRAVLDIPECSTVALYSGNMGAKQGLDILASAAVKLACRSDIVFVFCGEGPAKQRLLEQCGSLSNCYFLSLQPLSQLNELLNLADIHLLPQRSDAADLVMPSKLTGMLACGGAVVAMARPGTELFDVVSPRGVVVPPDDAAAIVAAIEALAASPNRRKRLGASARLFAEQMLSRDAIISRFEARLTTLVTRRDNFSTDQEADSLSIHENETELPNSALEKEESRFPPPS